ncbi:MAG: hypothetical protein K1X79_05350 [Oligoflexia bacterium]|nr:hypothetical protein [Oligoflexia bacterium]
MNSPGMGRSLVDIAAPIAAQHGGRLVDRAGEVGASDFCVQIAAGEKGIKSWAFPSREAAVAFKDAAPVEVCFRLNAPLQAEIYTANTAAQFLPN